MTCRLTPHDRLLAAVRRCSCSERCWRIQGHFVSRARGTEVCTHGETERYAWLPCRKRGKRGTSEARDMETGNCKKPETWEPDPGGAPSTSRSFGLQTRKTTPADCGQDRQKHFLESGRVGRQPGSGPCESRD